MSARPPFWIACVTGALAFTGHAGPPPCAPELEGNAVRVFAQAATADSTSTPARSVQGTSTGLCYPRDLAVDARGRLYVLDRRAITVYDSGASGDAAPVRSIVVTDSGFEGLGLGLDRRGFVYVGTDEQSATDSGSITVYARGAAGERAPLRTLRGPNTGLRRPIGVAVDGGGRIYATNFWDTVRVFARGATGDVAPSSLLAGSATGLSRPYGIALDSRGRLHVANGNGNSVTVYAPGATGDVAPVRTITTPRRLSPVWLSSPSWLALDAHDTIFVMTHHGVFVYPPDASGEVLPVRVIRTAVGKGLAVGREGSVYITGKENRISVFAPGAADSAEAVRTIEAVSTWHAPTGLAVGPGADTLYVAGMEGSSVTVYPPGAEGIARSVRKLDGPATEISGPQGLAVDRRGALYVANGPLPVLKGAVRVYGPNADGSAPPVRVLGGFATRLSHPADVAFDSRGQMYVANTDGYVTVYRPGATGNTAPIRTIAGPNTLLRRPAKLALGPGDTLMVLNTFDFSSWRGWGTGYTTVTVFTPQATGDIEPVRSIVVNGGTRSAGSKHGLDSPTGVAVDWRGSVYVANLGPGAVAVYGPGAAGDVTPDRLLPSKLTGAHSVGVAVSPRGELYVASWAGPFWDRWWWRSKRMLEGGSLQRAPTNRPRLPDSTPISPQDDDD